MNKYLYASLIALLAIASSNQISAANMYGTEGVGANLRYSKQMSSADAKMKIYGTEGNGTATMAPMYAYDEDDNATATIVGDPNKISYDRQGNTKASIDSSALRAYGRK